MADTTRRQMLRLYNLPCRASFFRGKKRSGRVFPPDALPFKYDCKRPKGCLPFLPLATFLRSDRMKT